MHKSIPALLTSAMAVVPVSNVFAASHASATKAKPVATRTYQGPSVDMQWGPVQVTIIVQGKHLNNIKVSAPTERARSAYINNIAVPMLVKEVLKAQVANIHNIYGISGATMTSEAFYQSLLSALKTAHLM
jgi:uncharacterized protein with FMN-binding domain